MFFGTGIDPRIIKGIFIFLLVYSLATMTSTELMGILATLPAVLMSITLHEYAHAAVAVHYGDNTPKQEGRLTLNPLKHFEWFGFIMLMFTHIGWGKPVRVNTNAFVGNKSPRFCEAMVALAGPMMNFILAIVFTIVYFAIFLYVPKNAITTYLVSICAYGGIVNVGMGLFNLIPIYPLDGEKIFRQFLPAKWRMFLQNNYQTICLIFFILWITSILGAIITPVIGTVYNGLLFVVGKIFGV